MKRLRIALSKGRLQSPTLGAFRAAGFDVPDENDLRSRRLVFEKADSDWVLVKDADLPVYVELGAADVAIAGLDQIAEQEPDVFQPLEFAFGRCRMMLISAPGAAPIGSDPRAKVATKYRNIATRYLASRGLHLDVVTLQGSVELAPVLNLAPYIVDLVETGETIRVHNLEQVGEVLAVAPRLIVNKNTYRMESRTVRDLVARLEAARVEA